MRRLPTSPKGSGASSRVRRLGTAASLLPAHVGIHAGPVLFQEGDYFGRTVNVASRVADYARPGEVLVTREVVAAAGEVPVTFTAIGTVERKGVSGSVQLFSAHRSEPEPAS